MPFDERGPAPVRADVPGALQLPQVEKCTIRARSYTRRLLIQRLGLCQLLIGNEEECKAHADLCRHRIERESLLLSGNGRGQLAKHGEQDGRSMQNIGIAGAKRQGLVQVSLRPSKVESDSGTQEAVCGVARGESWSKRDGLLCSCKRTVKACYVGG